ncbi:hypothetical protein ABPG72_021341 [Tetrahymena utriculariae]
MNGISNSSTLQSLKLILNQNNITLQNTFTLSSAFEKLKNLKKFILQFWENFIKVKGAQNISQCLKNCLNLEHLLIGLGRNNIQDECLKDLCQVFESCFNLKFLILQLDCNQISDKGIQYLCTPLSNLKNLSTLNIYISYNQLTSLGLIILVQALQKCQNLQNLLLYFSYNNISDMSSIGSELKKLDNLQQLYLWFKQSPYNNDQESNLINNQIDPKFRSQIFVTDDATEVSLQNELIAFSFLQKRYNTLEQYQEQKNKTYLVPLAFFLYSTSNNTSIFQLNITECSNEKLKGFKCLDLSSVSNYTSIQNGKQGIISLLLFYYPCPVIDSFKTSMPNNCANQTQIENLVNAEASGLNLKLYTSQQNITSKQNQFTHNSKQQKLVRVLLSNQKLNTLVQYIIITKIIFLYFQKICMKIHIMKHCRIVNYQISNLKPSKFKKMSNLLGNTFQKRIHQIIFICLNLLRSLDITWNKIHNINKIILNLKLNKIKLKKPKSQNMKLKFKKTQRVII